MTCKWTLDEHHDCWETECGEAHQFTTGNIEENNHKFCPYCGEIIEEEK